MCFYTYLVWPIALATLQPMFEPRHNHFVSIHRVNDRARTNSERMPLQYLQRYLRGQQVEVCQHRLTCLSPSQRIASFCLHHRWIRQRPALPQTTQDVHVPPPRRPPSTQPQRPARPLLTGDSLGLPAAANGVPERGSRGRTAPPLPTRPAPPRRQVSRPTRCCASPDQEFIRRPNAYTQSLVKVADTVWQCQRALPRTGWEGESRGKIWDGEGRGWREGGERGLEPLSAVISSMKK